MAVGRLWVESKKEWSLTVEPVGDWLVGSRNGALRFDLQNYWTDIRHAPGSSDDKGPVSDPGRHRFRSPLLRASF